MRERQAIRSKKTKKKEKKRGEKNTENKGEQEEFFFHPFDCENLHWMGKEREEKGKQSRGVEREEKENKVR
jgi:hypothetical protein